MATGYLGTVECSTNRTRKQLVILHIVAVNNKQKYNEKTPVPKHTGNNMEGTS